MTTAHSYIDVFRKERINDAKDQTMMQAIDADDIHLLRDALTAGANPNAGEGLPLIAAVIRGQFPLVQELANRGASFTFARKLISDEVSKWTLIYQKASSKSFEETKANTARTILGEILAKTDTYQTAYGETQERLNAQHQNKKLDEIVRAIDALRETIAEITTPKTIQKSASLGLVPPSTLVPTPARNN